jgi:Domain of unknown function (DUF6430)
MCHSLTLMFRTRRGITLLTRNTLVALGLLSGLLQIALALWPDVHLSGGERWFVLLALIAASLVFGLARAWPRKRISRHFESPDITIEVVVGDIFEQQSHLVVGFSDVFDTDTTNGVVIDPTSVQGQFQDRIYGGDLVRLDTELAAALIDVQVLKTESRTDKKSGKLDRYAIGTVAVLGDPSRHYFCIAYTKMKNNLIVESNVDLLWQSLGTVWEAVYLRGQRKPVSIPIVGSELARIACLDKESLLKMILLSFVARSRQAVVCKELKIVVRRNDYDRINMLEVAAFLRAL